MKTIEYKTNPEINRLGWPSGEWDNEPDKLQWLDEETGMPCLIVRNRLGALCGYVGVTKDHRFYGTDYDSVKLSDNDESYDEAHYPPAHGGLTYANVCQEGPEARTICHVVEEGEDDDVWWLGFDCLHAWDTSPGMMALDLRSSIYSPPENSYKNLAYVQNACAELAKWLKENA